MAISYSIGLLPNLGATGLHFYLHGRKMNSDAMLELRENLSAVGGYWNDSKNRIEVLKPHSLQEDIWSYRKGILTFGAICFLMSWLGFFIQVMIMISLRYIVISRFEQEILHSELAKKILPPEHIKVFIQDYRERFTGAVDLAP